MFKQLSQLGKSLTDELSRGLNEEGAENGSGEGKEEQGVKTGPKTYQNLPKDIQVKLAKFGKYEEKYPLLLGAYKAEKAKTEAAEAVLKILSENTPVSTLTDHAGLENYFRDVRARMDMANEEIRRLVEGQGCGEGVGELSDKLKRAEEAVAELEARQRGEATEAAKQMETLEQQLSEAVEAASAKGGALKECERKLEQSEKLIEGYKTTIQGLTKSVQDARASPGGNRGKKNRKRRGGGAAVGASSPEAEKEGSPGVADQLISSIELSSKYEQLLKDHEQMRQEVERHADNESRIRELEGEQKSLQKTLAIRTEELATVKEMLNNVQGQLADSQEHLASRSGEEALSKTKEEVEKYEARIKQLREELATVQARKKQLEDDNNTQLERTKVMGEESAALKEQIRNMQLQNNKLSGKLQGLSALENSEAKLKQQLLQKEKTIVYLEQQVKSLTTKEAETQAALRKLQHEKPALNTRIEELCADLERANAEIKKNEGLLESYLKKNGQLSERLDVMQEKYDTLQNMRSNSNDQVDSIMKQCEDLNLKIKDANRKAIALEDELNETTHKLQEKTLEASNLRKLLNAQKPELETHRKLEQDLDALILERDQLRSELDIQLSTKERDLKKTKETNNSLKEQAHVLSLKVNELEAEVERLRNLNQALQLHKSTAYSGSDEIETIVSNLKASLGESEQRLRQYKVSNEELKSLNNDLNEKFERLLRNYTQLATRAKNQSDHRFGGTSKTGNPLSPSPTEREVGSTTRRSSVNSDLHFSAQSRSPSEGELSEKVAYIKNVLLGFLEHKEQRGQLLPVVKTLLQLDSSDEKKLVAALR